MRTVAIAGAGLGGLTAALALAREGFRVDLVERTAVLSEAGAGVQLSPNATRVLRDLGLLEGLRAAAVQPDRVRVRRARDGADLASVPLGRSAEQRYGAPFLVAHRADVQALLLDAVRREPGIALALGVTLARFEATEESVDMSLSGPAGPRTLEAGGLIGADGIRSAVRSGLEPGVADRARRVGRAAWRTLIPAAAAPRFARQATSNLWLGRRAHLVHYPVRQGTAVNVVVIVEEDEQGAGEADAWSRPGEAAALRACLTGWCADALALIDAAAEWRVWSLYERPPLAAWSRGPVTLIGDAAHPMLPFLAQGAAQAIGDGWALGRAARARGSFAEIATAYERARRGIADRVQRESRRQGTIYHLGTSASIVRDAAMAALGPGRMLARYDWLYGRAG